MPPYRGISGGTPEARGGILEFSERSSSRDADQRSDSKSGARREADSVVRWRGAVPGNLADWRKALALQIPLRRKEKRLALGKYPEISLANARKRREAARELIANGVDPSEDKKAKRAEREARLENNFEAVAREWFAKHSPNWAPTHADKIIKRLENDVFPWLGKRPIADITAPELLKVLRRIEERGAVDTAHRAHQNCGQVMRYAVATGRATRDPSGDLRGSLPAPKHTHFAALTEPLQVAGLLRAMDAFEGTFTVQCALRLAPLVFVRPGELRKARWADIDLDKAEWRYVVSKTKTDHLVPLSTQAVAILRDLQAKTGHRMANRVFQVAGI
jgi:hypothetical protein